MFSSTEMLDGENRGLEVLAIETVPNYLLVRLRATVAGSGEATTADLVRTPATLRDDAGRALTYVQAASFGSGPFAGMLDLAFQSDPEFSVDGPMSLEISDVRLRFRRARRQPRRR